MIENKERYIIDFEDFPAKRRKMPELEVDKRIDNFDEVELGMEEAEAQQEARRCLSCRRCLGCALCWAACEPRAIVFEQEDEVLEMTVDDIIISEDDVSIIPANEALGLGKYKNVVSVFDIERMLDQHGPFSGMILRPFDGDMPATMAFIIDSSINGDEQSSNMVTSTLLIASAAQQNTDGVSISLFAPEKVSVDSSDSITVKTADVQEIKEIEASGNLTVSFDQGGSTSEEEFDLVVISSRPQVLPEIKELQKKIKE